MELKDLLSNTNANRPSLLSIKNGGDLSSIGDSKDPNILATLIQWVLWLSKEDVLDDMRANGYYLRAYSRVVLGNTKLIIILITIIISWLAVIGIEFYRSRKKKDAWDVTISTLLRTVFIEILPSFIFVVGLPYVAVLSMNIFYIFSNAFMLYFEKTKGSEIIELRGNILASKITDRVIFDVFNSMTIAMRKSTGVLESRPNTSL